MHRETLHSCLEISINPSITMNSRELIDIAGIRRLNFVNIHPRRGPHGEGRGQDTTGGGVRLGCLGQEGSGGTMPLRCVLC